MESALCFAQTCSTTINQPSSFKWAYYLGRFYCHLQAAINNCLIKFRLLPICVVLVFQYCTASSSWGNKENTWVHTDIYRNCQHAVNVSPLKRSSSGGHTDGWEAETVCSCHSVPGPTSCVCVHEEGGGGTTLDVSCQRKNNNPGHLCIALLLNRGYYDFVFRTRHVTRFHEYIVSILAVATILGHSHTRINGS